MDRDPNKSPGEFPTTWWTLIDRALADGTTVRTHALDELVCRYLPPLRAHLVLRKRLAGELADDLLQGFVSEKFLAQYLLRHADRSKGKFRSLLVRSLENYYLDWVRDPDNQPHGGTDALADAAVAAAEIDADIFDAAWAQQLLDEVLAAMRADCQASKQEAIWGVFECRLLVPAREDAAVPSYEDLCERFGFAAPEQASNALVTAKRKFQKVFARVAVRYQHDDEEAEDVLRELSAILSRVGPLDWRQVPAASGRPSDGSLSSHDALEDSHPTTWTRLLNLGPVDADALWRAEDLAGMMRHQLNLRLADLDLKVAPEEFAAASREVGSEPLLTLGDLLAHKQPPLVLLEAVKRYGRKRVHRDDRGLPGEIASALYFASIAAALVRQGQRITSSDDEMLRFGFKRVLERPWIGSPLRELFEGALAQIGPAEAAATKPSP